MESIEWECPICEADNTICCCEVEKHLKGELKSQAKEIEGLREWKGDAAEMLDNIKYWDTVPDDYLERIENLLSLGTTQPDKGGE